MLNQKHSAKYVCRTGTSASSTARAGTSCETERKRNKKFVQYTMDLFSIPNYYIKKRATPRAPLREESQEITSTSSRIRSRRNARRRDFLGIDDQFIRDEKIPQEYV